MRIRLAIGPAGPRHDAGIPWWNVEYRRGAREWSEYVEAWTRDEAAAEVAGPGVSVLRVGQVGGESLGAARRPMTLEGIERELAGRALVRAVGDPVLPFVSRVAQAIFARMSADVDGDVEGVRAAEAEYDAIVEEATAAAAEWRAEGRGDYARRLEILLRAKL